MSPLLLNSFRWCNGLAVLASPLLAAEPTIPIPARSDTAIIARNEADGYLIPPAPLAAIPSTNMTSSGSIAPYSRMNLSIAQIGVPQATSATGSAGYGTGAIYGTPGGYEARIGSPYHYYDPSGGQYVVTGNPYYDHYGPGYHRHSLHGHYRFPYYNYRAPWYYPGRAVYNRDTNFAW